MIPTAIAGNQGDPANVDSSQDVGGSCHCPCRALPQKCMLFHSFLMVFSDIHNTFGITAILRTSARKASFPGFPWFLVISAVSRESHDFTEFSDFQWKYAFCMVSMNSVIHHNIWWFDEIQHFTDVLENALLGENYWLPYPQMIPAIYQSHANFTGSLLAMWSIAFCDNSTNVCNFLQSSTLVVWRKC